MKRVCIGRVIPIFLLLVVACTEPPEVKISSLSQPDTTAIEIEWSDLMPTGEVARLEMLYDDYYRGLEAELLDSAKPLSEVGDAMEMIDEGSELDQMPQLGTYNTVAKFHGKTVRLPGFVVPLDYADKKTVKSFLFVPYFGACIHTPPPPPNQIVYIEGEWHFEDDDIYRPYWAEGVLTGQAGMSDLGNAAYTMQLSRLTPYEY